MGRNNPFCQTNLLWDCGRGLWQPVVRSRSETFFLGFVVSIFSAHSVSKLQATGFEMFVATHERACFHNAEDRSRNFHPPPTTRISSTATLCTLKAEVGEIFPEALLRVSVLRQMPWRSAVFSVSACVLPICFSNWYVLVLWRRILWKPVEEWPPQRSQRINLQFPIFSTEIRGSRCAENFVCGCLGHGICSFAVSIASVSEERAASIFAYRTIYCIINQKNITQITLNNAQLKIFSRKLHTFSV